ncbi:hypothetical protein [uncultured Flavonifractor sp.]|nr:hypothetical protein [uncultured Flavonifractor sp.]
MKLLYRWKNEGVAARIGSSIWPGKKTNEKWVLIFAANLEKTVSGTGG